jgi:hypothetical protein
MTPNTSIEFRGKFRETAGRATPLLQYYGEKIGTVCHYVRDVGVAGSNPVTPTIIDGSIRQLSLEVSSRVPGPAEFRSPRIQWNGPPHI